MTKLSEDDFFKHCKEKGLLPQFMRVCLAVGIRAEKSYEELLGRFAKQATKLKVPPAVASRYHVDHKGKCKFFTAMGIVVVTTRRQVKAIFPAESISE